MKYFICLLLPFLASFNNELLCQIHISDFFILQQSADTTTVGEFFSRSGFVAQFQRGMGNMSAIPTDADGIVRASNIRRDRAWNVKLGGYFDIYRFNASTSLLGYAFHEMNANALNDISFNPRSAQWEERIEVSNIWSIDNVGAFSAGVFHRCKHDIDNSDDEISDTPSPLAISKRVLILTGGAVSFGFDKLKSMLFGTPYIFMANLRVEAFASTADTRFPYNTIGRSWTDARAAFYGMVGHQFQLSPHSSLNIRLNTSSMYFTETSSKQATIETSSRIEAGYRYTSKKGSSFTLYYSYDSIFDEVVRVIPQSIQVHSLGIRTQPSELW